MLYFGTALWFGYNNSSQWLHRRVTGKWGIIHKCWFNSEKICWYRCYDFATSPGSKVLVRKGSRLLYVSHNSSIGFLWFLFLLLQVPKRETIKTAESRILNIICLKHLLELVHPLKNAIISSKNHLFKTMVEVSLSDKK